ncbi:MAG TPA: hypothetical protein VEC99_14840 [Clostridia bacterium]|nr:hypothetical protein [Clostridia bacterium]
MDHIQKQLDYADAISDWFVDLGENAIQRGELETGLKYLQIAASIFSRQNRWLAVPRIETALQAVARELHKGGGSNPAPTKTPGQKDVCLHILSEALPAGGHSAMAVRWIKGDRSGRRHCVALIAQKTPVPTALAEAVREKGGSVHIADPNGSLSEKAVWLRKLANELASHVVLHIDTSDVVCGAAFGTRGGPPILLVNHAAHVFWAGAAYVDSIVNCRGSALETLWTTVYRGASKCCTIPIPLVPRQSSTVAGCLIAEAKRQAKASIGLPEDSVVILTVGAAFKYTPLGDIDFVQVCERLLRKLPNALVLGVGFAGDDHWNQASARVGSRMLALGVLPRDRLECIQDASDIYIEGFPFGTTTSLLEAGLRGIPVVLSPEQCPPPYGTDGVALDELGERPATMEAYAAQVIRLARNPEERIACGERAREAIARHHTGDGWNQYLQNALKSLPAEHCPKTSINPLRTPEAIHEYWARFIPKWLVRYEETFETALTYALSDGLHPHLNGKVRRAFHNFKSVRRRKTIPAPVATFFCNYLSEYIPSGWRVRAFRIVRFLCRASLLARLRHKLSHLVVRSTAKPSGYDEYRRINDWEKKSDPVTACRALKEHLQALQCKTP